MNTIYLIVDKGNKMAKIGFTSNLEQRIYAYTTANPKAYIRDYCLTHQKTGLDLERKAQHEMAKRGGRRLYASMDGKKTEWFDFEHQPEFFNNLLKNGLQALTTCRGRKSYGVYTK